jgi:CIC family chloride channel protein
MPAFPVLDATEIPSMIVLGLVSGFGATQFLRTLALGRALFARFAAPLPVKLGLGGLAVGAISVWIPQVWGNGYSVTNSLLHTPWLWTSVMTILVAKVVATALTTGSGAVGGIFTPTLFVGATVGWLFGTAIDRLLPGSFQPAAYAVIGMGAFLAGATGAPIMALLMIFEMTLSYEAMLPLMLACVVAWSSARAFGAPAMYQAMQERQAADLERTRLARSTVAALVSPADPVSQPSTPVDELLRIFLAHRIKYLYVTDDAGRFVGVVPQQDLIRTMLDDTERSALTAADLLQKDFPYVLVDSPVTDALATLRALQIERLPVVADAATMKLVGVITKSAVIDVLARLTVPVR